MMKGLLSRFQPVISVLFGLALGLAVTLAAGENPFHVLKILASSAFSSPYNLGMTLFYATPLIFTGLAVAIPFHAGLFNIGAEGQLTIGALCAAAFGILFPNISYPWAPLLAGGAAFLGGAIYGAIPGYLKAKRGSHEVINTIMLNFVAAGIASYVTLYLLKSQDSQNPETHLLSESYGLRHWSYFGDAPLSSALILGLICAFLVWVFLWKTSFGFEIRALGQSEPAARLSGVSPGRAQITAMAIAGGMAGLVGVSEVLGNSMRFKMGFSPDYGFIGIAVALLGRNRPMGVVAAALLFGALHKGTADLDFETQHVTRDLSLVMQALIILSVSSVGLWDWMKRGRAWKS